MRDRIPTRAACQWSKTSRAALPGLCVLLLLAPSVRAEQQVLGGHVPEAVGRLRAIGRLQPARRLNLAIGLPLRNREALTNLIEAIYDPASPRFRQYLIPGEFAAAFGPSEEDYEAVAAFMAARGLTVSARHPNRVVLDVNGTVADIEKALHVSLKQYSHPDEARAFYAPDSDPVLDLAVPLLHISGLDNYRLPRPALVRPGARPAGPTPNLGSGPGGSYMGYDFRAAYVPGVSLTGAGQVVGLLEFDGFHASDIASYESQAGLPTVPLQTVLLDNFGGAAGNGNDEVALDIEMAISMAPGLSKVILYEAGPLGSGNDMLNRMATDNVAKQLSSSWTFSTDATTSQVFQEMAAQGQSFFNASGDSDAYSGPISAPADSPYVTVVGGTTLTTSGPSGAWVSETVWNWGSGQGSGGGISTSYSLPSWQAGVSMAANQGSVHQRNIPDVAMAADNVFEIADNGRSLSGIGGTSCATPMWAGFTALVNQQAAASGKSPVGFLNPVLYAIGEGSGYNSAFHDITTGNNTSASSPSKFFAVAGYDLCTGWGTPTGSNLINALVTPAFVPIVTAGSWALLTESCQPTNGAVNPGELVTVAFALEDSGLGGTTNLIATLLATNGVTLPGTPQSYGALSAGGPAVSRPFSFVAAGACGSNITAVLQLQDGAANLGTVSFSLPLGSFTPFTTFAQNFDSVAPPALPSAWTMSATGGASNWVTSTASSDSPPNSAFAAEPPSPGLATLVSPAIPIISSSAHLSFRNKYNFETSPSDATLGYDGGTLEIQIGDGAFADILAAGGAFVVGGYTGTIDVTDVDNPLAGQAAWTGQTAGFTTTTIALPSAAAGQSVRFEWQFGTDTGNAYGGTGWYIDSISIVDGSYSCCIPATAVPALVNPQSSSGNFSFSFQTVSGQSYTIQYTDDLANPSWTTLYSFTGDGSVRLVADTPGVSQRFYRVTSPQ
ncbi:MAG: protease pro-enzyme activation domain-containing protein [Limisphaerales bacterium]